jgi:hypothetical protein
MIDYTRLLIVGVFLVGSLLRLALWLHFSRRGF